MTRPARSKIARLLYGILAYVSLGVGLVAIVIPGLPTTEFILLAAWAVLGLILFLVTPAPKDREGAFRDLLGPHAEMLLAARREPAGRESATRG